MAGTDGRGGALETKDRVETPHGTVCIDLTSESVARVDCGVNVGWMDLGGRKLYPSAMLQRPGGGDVWVINPAYGAVHAVVDGKPGERVDLDTRDAAWKVLRDAFDAWLPTRPDLVAGVALAARRREERAAEERVSDLEAELARARTNLSEATAAREEAEEGYERALDPPDGLAP